MSRDDRRLPVCVFAKPPMAGEVKTRLAQAVGAVPAARLARAFFRDTWAMVRALAWARPILASTTQDTSTFGVGTEVEVWMQGPGDLGARMERILARGIAEAGRALVIGADVPGLPPGHLEMARAALDHDPAVVGPAHDGGFYLLGLSRLPAGVLADIPWSSPDTLTRTELRLTEAGLTVARGPSWFDVDELPDLVRLQTLLASDASGAPHTERAIHSVLGAGRCASL